jgi:hypothetical protein
VLVEQRRPGRGVLHTHHQLFEARARGGGEGVADVRRSWKCRSGRSTSARTLFQMRRKPERRSGPPRGPTNTRPSGPSSANSSSALADPERSPAGWTPAPTGPGLGRGLQELAAVQLGQRARHPYNASVKRWRRSGRCAAPSARGDVKDHKRLALAVRIASHRSVPGQPAARGPRRGAGARRHRQLGRDPHTQIDMGTLICGWNIKMYILSVAVTWAFFVRIQAGLTRRLLAPRRRE